MRKAPMSVCHTHNARSMRNKEMLSKATGEKPHYIQKKKDNKVSKFFYEKQQITRHWSNSFKYKKKKEILNKSKTFLMYT